MRKRILSLVVCIFILLLNVATVFSAAKTDDGSKSFPYAVAYSTVKEMNMEKTISEITCVEMDTQRTVVDTRGNSVFPVSGKFVKLMSVYTALRYIKSDSILINDKAVIDPNNNPLLLKPGMTVAVLDLIASAVYSNDRNAVAALALSCSKDFNEFCRFMNGYAASLGMKDTVYTNIFGNFDEKMVTTTDDLALLTYCCNRSSTLSDMLASSDYFLKTDEILKDKKKLINDFKMIDSSSEYYNSNIYGIGVDKDKNNFSVCSVIYITTKQKYIVTLRAENCDIYAVASDCVDYVTRNYALADISKIIFELGEKTTLKINGETVNFNVLKNTVSTTNIAVNLYYSKSVSKLNESYTVVPPQELPETVRVGDVIKGFQVLYNGNPISTMSLVVESIGEKKEEEKTLNFTIYEKEENAQEKKTGGNFITDHIWLIGVGLVAILGIAVIFVIEKLK